MLHRLLAPAAILTVTVAGADARPGADCSRTSVGFTPVTDLGPGTHYGYRGGLYRGGKNAPSARYLAKGLAQARLVKPIVGKIVLLSIGMSNTTQEFSAFQQLAGSDPRKSSRVQLVDGAVGGQDAEIVKDPSSRYWSVVDERLSAAGATAQQVQAVWLKEAIARPTEPFPADAERLEADLRAIVGLLPQRFPKLRLVYLSSRTYGGYATTPLNPEPYAYDSGFAVKWLVQQRIDGKLGGPWLGWGPYLWTDGTKGRRDGLAWTCADVRPSDGTHPSDNGRQKVARLLLRFFTTDPTARRWFSRP